MGKVSMRTKNELKLKQWILEIKLPPCRGQGFI